MSPAFKATQSSDVGYGVYDLFDLGEFDQKGSIRTKYETKDDYLKTIQILRENGIEAIADVVLNHKAAADKQEQFSVVEVDPNDRDRVISEPFDISAWTHFTGVDYEASHNKNRIYMIRGENNGWANDNLVDDENGNYDYLMYDDIDFKHPEVR